MTESPLHCPHEVLKSPLKVTSGASANISITTNIITDTTII